MNSIAIHSDGFSWFLLILCLSVISVANVRTTQISNELNIALLTVGIVALVLRAGGESGFAAQTHWLFWAVAFVALFVAMANGLAGGVGKMFIACLPWLDLENFLILMIVSWLLWFGIGYAVLKLRDSADKNFPAVPSILFAAIGMGVYRFILPG
jgi:Flp pilus assembly protein protease CpaA